MSMLIGMQVTYRPTRMTPVDTTDAGSLFLATTNGMALLFRLQGRADPPECSHTVYQDICARDQHVEEVMVCNWLAAPQRFNVRITIEEVCPFHMGLICSASRFLTCRC